uniref:Predicted protein n=1 Tax=Hordeum vulgare subsp. vulgare TaxID=112509 RepID=F2D0D2_HORVV|nr:predicted protein [Hordeum vulgare subsp. vulgare]
MLLQPNASHPSLCRVIFIRQGPMVYAIAPLRSRDGRDVGYLGDCCQTLSRHPCAVSPPPHHGPPSICICRLI